MRLISALLVIALAPSALAGPQLFKRFSIPGTRGRPGAVMAPDPAKLAAMSPHERFVAFRQLIADMGVAIGDPLIELERNVATIPPEVARPMLSYLYVTMLADVYRTTDAALRDMSDTLKRDTVAFDAAERRELIRYVRQLRMVLRWNMEVMQGGDPDESVILDALR